MTSTRVGFILQLNLHVRISIREKTMNKDVTKTAAAATGGGIGFFGLLTIVFIVMKLMGWGEVATWSWLWVLSPLWLSWAFYLSIFVIVVIGFLFIAWLGDR